MTGRVEQPVLVSEVLAGNALGDSHARPVPVYLPPGYDEESARRYPVIVMLTGYGGTGPHLLNLRPWDESLPQQLDRLIGSGAMAPAIVVMPDCWTRYGGSQYLNSAALGRYEDYLIQEVIPFVDHHYHTLPDRAHRAIVGKSSGGYGALVQGMHHPEVFGAVACHSGDMYFEFSYIADLARLHANLASLGGWETLRDTLETIRPKNTKLFETVSTLAYGMAYAPNPDAPDGFDFPIDRETGALREDVWARWLAHDPVRKLDEARYAEALRSLKLLYIDWRERDDFNLQVGSRVLTRKLAALGIACHYEEFPDGHFNIHYRYDISLPMLSEAAPALTMRHLKRPVLAFVFLARAALACMREQTSPVIIVTATPAQPLELSTRQPGEQIPFATMTAPPQPEGLIVPTLDPARAYTPEALPESYVVQAGDTLSGIAQRFGTTVEQLIAMNQIPDASLLAVGQLISLPSVTGTISPAVKIIPDSELVRSRRRRA